MSSRKHDRQFRLSSIAPIKVEGPDGRVLAYSSDSWAPGPRGMARLRSPRPEAPREKPVEGGR
jgi:hypothetical protein